MRIRVPPEINRSLNRALIGRSRVRHAVVEVVADLRAPKHGRHAADVVGVIVARDQQVQGVDPQRL